MRNYIALLFFLVPQILISQPFKIKEVKARYVTVNQSSYYDVHTVLLVRKASEKLSIDSIQLDGLTLSPLHLSVLARSVQTSRFEKGDSVLIKGTVIVKDTLIKEGLAVFYHLPKGRPKSVFFNKSEIIRLEDIYFQHNY